MKASHFVTVLTLACACMAPLCADTQLQSKAVSLASAKSGATISDICYAVYNAVKANPAQADKVFAAVLAQRSDWTSPQVYAILRSTMMACPGLDAYIGASRPSSEDGDSQGGEAAVPAMMQSLLQVLGQSSLPQNVTQGVFSSLAMTSSLSYGQVYGIANPVQVVDGDPLPPASGEVVPAPGDMSPLH